MSAAAFLLIAFIGLVTLASLAFILQNAFGRRPPGDGER